MSAQKLYLEDRARKFIARADVKTRRIVSRHIAQLQEFPNRRRKHLQAKAGCNWQEEFGGFRIEFTLTPERLTILRITPRRDNWRRSTR